MLFFVSFIKIQKQKIKHLKWNDLFGNNKFGFKKCKKKNENKKQKKKTLKLPKQRQNPMTLNCHIHYLAKCKEKKTVQNH